MQKKIKLIFFHPFSNIGGADNSLKRLIERLDLKKYSNSNVIHCSYLRFNKLFFSFDL